jgi:hypothetical protein
MLCTNVPDEAYFAPIRIYEHASIAQKILQDKINLSIIR